MIYRFLWRLAALLALAILPILLAADLVIGFYRAAARVRAETAHNVRDYVKTMLSVIRTGSRVSE